VAKFPDLTGDGEVTRADVLKARGVFRRGGRVKKMAMGGRADTGTAKANPKSPPLSPDVEADLKALETRTQSDFTPSSGPKRRYPAGKVKRYPEERGEFEIPKTVLRGLGKTRNMAKGGMAHSSASRRADGIAQRGKTRGRFV
jgi:hypothetical protein